MSARAVELAGGWRVVAIPEGFDGTSCTLHIRWSEVPAVATLNDQGFHFRVHPPELHTSERGPRSTEDVEALVLCFETSDGPVFMNIALRYHTDAVATTV